MDGMIGFIEEDDDDVKLSDLPFMKKKLAEQERAFQEKELVFQKKLAEKDALIEQLLAQIK